MSDIPERTDPGRPSSDKDYDGDESSRSEPHRRGVREWLAGLFSDLSGLRPLFLFGASAGFIGTLVFGWLTSESYAPVLVAPKLAEGPTKAS